MLQVDQTRPCLGSEGGAVVGAERTAVAKEPVFLPRILVFLPSPNEVQRFVLGQAFRELSLQFSVIYVLPEADRAAMEPLIRSAEPDADIRFVAIDPKRFKEWSKLFKAACYRYSDRSRSFAIRMDRSYAGPDGLMKLKADLALFSDSAETTGQPADVADGSPPEPPAADDPRRMFGAAAFDGLKEATLAKLQPHPEITALLDEIAPLFVVLPTSLLDLFCNDVLWACEQRGVASLAIQSGWDNLSSKGIIHHQPTWLAVWGRQSREHASDIQSVQREQAIPVGAPHYEALVLNPRERERIRADLGLSSGETLVLFGGSFRQFDETSALVSLDKLISKRGLPVRILYRPHPYRLDRPEEADFFEMKWRNVVFDEEMNERYRLSKKERGYIKRARPLYSMDYLAGVLSAVDAVLSPMSTLLLEAMIMDRPTMAIAFSDDRHVDGASAFSEMTHFDVLQGKDQALLWCGSQERFLSDFRSLVDEARRGDDERAEARRRMLGKVVRQGPRSYGHRLASLTCSSVAPAALKARDEAAARRTSISHHYFADRIIRDYVDEADETREVPGFWMHGWLPPHFNADIRAVATHKTVGEEISERRDNWDEERASVAQWVSRPDQAEALREGGYARVEAIGLPFAYLPDVSVERRPNTLLVMPPHGQKKFFDAGLARRYARQIRDLRREFDAILVCVAMRDYYRGEWRQQFQDVGIPVTYGAGPNEPDSLLRLKRMLSSFEFVTCNAFGSQIAYAAHCGAKVSIWGSFCEWPVERWGFAAKLHPDLAAHLSAFQSEAVLQREMPFLFRHPRKAEEWRDWGDAQIGLDSRRSPDAIRTLFGWNDR